MTPEVAAPEQVRGGAISTATDVYALGILLYLLLTGERPYDLRGKSPSEVERTICDYEPPAPSTRAPAVLRRRIRGDLDLIAATALQKSDARRYQSPAALAEDLRRFQRGQAIVARPDTFTYRLGRFVARHRVAVAAGVLAMIGVAAAVGRETVLRQRAQIEARKAREVENFLVGVFDVADPFAFAENDRGTIRARDLLDRGARRIDSTLVDQPEVQADLRAVLGRVYTNLGLLEQATPLLQRALDQRTAVLGAGDTAVATAMDLLGTALARQNKYAEAERLLRAALDQRRKLLGNRSAATAESMNHLATMLEDRNQYAPAESLHRESLAIKRSIFGDGSLEVASSMNDLALIRSRRGAYAEADSLFRPVLTIYLRRFGERHALTAATMQNMASNYQFSGKLDDAERYYRRSLAAKRAVLGEMHPSITISLNNFGAFLANNGKLEEGESMVRDALRLDRKMFGDRHSYVAESLRNLGNILRNKGDFVPADSAYQAALSINRELFGERHERIANLYGQMAQIRYQLGSQAEAIRLLRESLAQFNGLLGPTHLNTMITAGNLARMLSESSQRDVVEADSLSRATLAKLDSSNAAQRPFYITTYRTLGAALLAEHRVDEALPVLSRALDMTRRQYGEDNWRTAYAQLSYGNALVAKQRFDDAGPVLHSAQATLDKHRADQPRLVAQVAAAVASLGSHGAR
jgi:serine/threonine-protein kinase